MLHGNAVTMHPSKFLAFQTIVFSSWGNLPHSLVFKRKKQSQRENKKEIPEARELKFLALVLLDCVRFLCEG